MIAHTQSRLEPATEGHAAKGNCWQTCAASILELPIDALPDQVEAEDGGWSFGNVLRAYLWKHHRKWLINIYEFQIKAPLRVDPDVYYIACGPTERTATNGGVHHCVVAKAGQMVWDPHPSRAGLLDAKELELLVDHDESMEPPRPWSFGDDRDCLCPECGGVIPRQREVEPIPADVLACPQGSYAHVAYTKLRHWAFYMAARYNGPVYLVGSALRIGNPRDVDIRVVVSDEEFKGRYKVRDAHNWQGERPQAWIDDMAKRCSELAAKDRLNVDFQVYPASHCIQYREQPRVLLAAPTRLDHIAASTAWFDQPATQ